MNTNIRWNRVAVYATMIVVGFALILLAGCGNEDTKGRTDLPEDNITLDTEQMDVIVAADGFPNIGHKCRRFGTEGAIVGFWTTTDRTLILVYNDYACEGANREQDMVVINGVPRAVINSGGG